MIFVDPLNGNEYTEINLGEIYQGYSSRVRKLGFRNNESVDVSSVTIYSDINDPNVSFAKSKDKDFDMSVDSLFFKNIYAPGEIESFYVLLSTDNDAALGDNSLTLNIEAYEQV
ncbi:MAG: hypothetical protein ACOCRO_07680 [Halanaerobiales bacterium]